MEPVSTILLVASMFAGAATTRAKQDTFSSEATVQPNNSLILPIVPSARTTQILVAPEVAVTPVGNAKESLYNQLATYLPGHKSAHATVVSNGDDVFVALKLIQQLPGYLPLPTLMRNDAGEIGMYWDEGDIYIDINIDENDAISLFTRVRSTEQETFVSDIHIDTVNSEWLELHLALLAEMIKNDNSYAVAA